MHRADSPKPPLAPKPKVTTNPPTPPAKFPPSQRPNSFPSPNSMSRGPKPPIAPKPRLTGPSEYGAGVYLNNSLSKCSNGRLLCQDRGLYDGHHSTLNCLELETDEQYIMVPRGPQREDVPMDGATEEQGFEEEVQEHGTEQTETEEDLVAPDEEAPRRDSEKGMGHTLEDEEDCDHDPETDGTPTAPDERAPSRDSEEGEEDCDQGPRMEEQPMSEEEGEEEEVKEHMYNRDDRAPWDGAEPFPSEVILTHVCSQSPEVPCWEPGPPEILGDTKEDGEDICNNTEPEKPNQDTDQDTEDASMGSPENDVSPDVQEQETATDSPEVFEDPADAAEGEDQIDQEGPLNCDEDTYSRESAAAAMQVGEDLGEDGDHVQEDPAEESCQIIPFESGSVEEDFSPTLTENPYEIFPTESTSFCNNTYSLDESANGQEPVCKICVEEVPGIGPSLNEHHSLQDGSGEDSRVPDVVVVPENEDSMDDALSSPYVMGVGLQSLGEGAQSDTQTASGTLSGYSTWEEGDSDGGQVPVDRKNIATRAWPHSGKVAGHVPETVLEETGPEACSSAVGIRDTSDEVRKIGILPEGKPPESVRALPAKPRAFTLYPRSFSVEGRESPLSMFREPEGAGLDSHRVRRKEDNLSLPGAIGSSGSFSQRSHLPSSGTSTPSSVVDIPPPFDLACITKKPITKSSPSLLIDGDTLEKASKKKKSSFKRFLELTFRKKTESKVHVDMNLSSSRSSSESSYHGPARVLELDRRSLSNSPQLKCRTGKLRASDSPASLIFYRDSKRRGVPFSRTVSRVESFEDRSRPPFLPLPLTKPRSISFPNADTSDYENIPAMNSDYENIQIPPRRPARTGTFTKLFEEQSRALSTANENDGYVDMSSFNAFESKQQSCEQEAESAYTEPYKVCPISAAPREDLTSDEEQGSSEEEDSASRDPSLSHKVEGQSRALVIAQELLSSEKAYVQMLQHLSLDFHGAVLRALENVEQEGREPLAQEELRQGLQELPAICDLHQGILESLEQRLGDCGEGQPQVADIFLAREQEFEHHAAHILQFDRYLGLLAESCLLSPRLATTVREFEQSSQGGGQSMKHRMLRVVQRLFQYQVLLTDYLNNLCPDSAEYDNTQSALTLISKVTDRANESMEQGENLQKLVHIEYSVRGQGDLLQPGREFLKEGTLMRVRGKSRHPRHLFLMNDTLLYTHPQKDGKYRLKSSLPVANMKVEI
ncbi:FYVE, RhoGEF and PH domain-containing protein 5 isoform X2 [Grammomys surdaster]|uniref:FYVE, RhoGEF and PH domain-containing protein 5 isoform X2 n=1 Tax=Grammomys surdaster TaxID=491861 RepID=UPI00109F358E|nr:FYVE, RhoGEF and PH domain-containing protein 5 isoform X2 [Grammomys surdaster]